jgi:hypothetical protein
MRHDGQECTVSPPAACVDDAGVELRRPVSISFPMEAPPEEHAQSRDFGSDRHDRERRSCCVSTRRCVAFHCA